MAVVFGVMPIEDAWRFASISEFDPEIQNQVYQAVGERVLATMYENTETLPEPRTYLIELFDKRIIGFPCAVTGNISPASS